MKHQSIREAARQVMIKVFGQETGFYGIHRIIIVGINKNIEIELLELDIEQETS